MIKPVRPATTYKSEHAYVLRVFEISFARKLLGKNKNNSNVLLLWTNIV